MLKEFNLLATTSRGYESYAREELSHLLEKIGDPNPSIGRTGISGLIAVKTSLDPFEAIEKFRCVLHEKPYEFRYTLRLIPIERIVRTDLTQIEEAVAELGAQIQESETFRVTVEKRFTATSSREIIEKAAAKIKRKVNLSKPDKIILIEIVGGSTGISLIEPKYILSVLKEKLL
jgi:tRNA acetyltransferase TAN1